MNAKTFGFLINVMIMSIACSDFKNTKADLTNVNHFDTIKFEMPNLNELDDSCVTASKSYYKRFGLVLSQYYIVEDSLAIDLNSDSKIDTVFVLSPVSLQFVECNKLLRFDSLPNRLLVEALNYGNGVSRIRKIYDNLISNAGGVLSKYNGMNITSEGFDINHQAGSRYSWEYSMILSTKESDSLRLIQIIKKCSFDETEKKISYNYYPNGKSVANIKINDTINLQCNCDSILHQLEKEKK